MDINCGAGIDGTAPIEEVGSKGFQMVLDCASGTKVKERVARVRAERVCPLADGGHHLTPPVQGTKADGQAAEASGLGPSVQGARDGLPGPTCGRSSRQDLMVVVQELALAAAIGFSGRIGTLARPSSARHACPDHNNPRPARFRISAPVPKVHGSQSGACFMRLTSWPSCGAAIVTMSPTLCVKPCPGASRSSTGANIVPRNSTAPSG